MSDKQGVKIDVEMSANPEKSVNSKSFDAFLVEKTFTEPIE